MLTEEHARAEHMYKVLQERLKDMEREYPLVNDSKYGDELRGEIRAYHDILKKMRFTFGL